MSFDLCMFELVLYYWLRFMFILYFTGRTLWKARFDGLSDGNFMPLDLLD